MPPKKRLRGPRLASVQEESTTTADDTDQLENEEFANEKGPDLEVVGEKNTAGGYGDSKEEKRMRRNVIDAFRQTFQARSDINHDISLSTQKICNIYKSLVARLKKSPQVLEQFFQEIDVRLVMFIEELTLKENRSRVFKMISLAALEIYRDAEDLENRDDRFLNFIVDFIEQWGESQQVAPRMNSSSLITYLVESGIKSTPIPGEHSHFGLPMATAEKLFLQVKRSLLDREHQARTQAIRSLGVMSKVAVPSEWSDAAKESSPRELLMRSFRDIHHECRMVAVQVFVPREEDVPVLSDLVMYDKSLKVRIEALFKIGELRPGRFVREKIECLQLALNDHEVSMRAAARKLINSWIIRLSERWAKGQKEKMDADVIVTDVDDRPLEVAEQHKCKGFILAAAALMMLWMNETAETAEGYAKLKRLASHMMDVVRQLYHCHQEPINTLAEVLMNDLKATNAQQELSVPMITKSGISRIMEESELNEVRDLRTNRAMIFFWKCTIDYLVERRRNEADKMNAVTRFMTPLKSMVESFESILQRLKEYENDAPSGEEKEETVEKVYILEMSLVENFLSVMKYAPSDQAGKDAYRTLLIRMLVNPCYQKKILDAVVAELAEFYTECPEDLLSLIYSKVNEVRQKSRASGLLPSIEGSVLIGEKHIRNKYEDGTKLMELYELMVLNAVLKTGILKEWAEEYEHRYHKLIKKSIRSKDTDMKVLAMECVGIIAHYDMDKVESMLGEMIGKFAKLEEPERATMFTVLTDLAISVGLPEVDRLMKMYAANREQHFTKLLSDIIVSTPPGTESEVLMKAVESLAKILLHSTVIPTSPMWQCALVSMMFRAAYAITDRFSAKVRSTIVIMLNFFCTLNRNNQLLVVRSFRQFYNMWEMSASIQFLSGANEDEPVKKLKRCAMAFISLTRHSNLCKEARKSQPAQVSFVDEVFAEMMATTASNIVEYFVVAFANVEFESFTRPELLKIHGDLVEFVDMHADHEDKAIYNDLKRTRRKIGKILGVNEQAELEEEQEAPRARALRRKQLMERLALVEQEENQEEQQEEQEPEEEPPKRRGRGAQSAQKPKKKKDTLEILASPPQRNPRKPSSRQNTGTRPAAPPTAPRTAPPRSARRLLRSDK